MNRARRNGAAALIATMITPIVCAGAQHLAEEGFGGRWPDEPLPRIQAPPAAVQQAPPAAAQQTAPAAEPDTTPRRTARAPTRSPDIAGSWSGKVTQVGSESKYTVMLTITAKGAEINYPELGCGGKLSRVGVSSSYAFFVEAITRGQLEKGGRCPDGTISLARVGDNLGWVWFGSVQGEVIVAFSTLSRKTAR